MIVIPLTNHGAKVPEPIKPARTLPEAISQALESGPASSHSAVFKDALKANLRDHLTAYLDEQFKIAFGNASVEQESAIRALYNAMRYE